MSFFGQSATSGSSPSNLFSTSGTSVSSGSGPFGTASTSNNAGSLFGSASTSRAATGLFGSKSATTQGTASASGTIPTGSSPFGSSPAGTPSFSSALHSSAQAPTSLFSATPAAGASGTSLFATPNKSGNSGKAQDVPKISFNNTDAVSAGSAGGGLFNLTGASGGIASTPAQSKMNLFGHSSTTPAGVPPNGTSSPAPLFASTKHSGPAIGSLTPSAPTATPNLFTTNVQSSSAAPLSSMSQSGVSKQSTSLFAGTPSNSTSNTPSTSNASSQGVTTSGLLFAKQPLNSTPSSASTSTTVQPGVSITGPPDSSSSQTKPVSTFQTTSKSDMPAFSFSTSATNSINPGLHSTGSAAHNAPSTLFATSPAGTSEQIGPGNGHSIGLSAASQPEISKSSTPATTAPTSKPLFSSSAVAGTGTTSSASISGPSALASNDISTASGQTQNGTGLSTSTVGPKPMPQSRLKNKSMDEIITRWATDLQRYQKDFHKQAAKVAEWDKVLVSSSEQIQRLYGNTLEAERATAEMERQLSVVENDQSEIEYWLDLYEKQVDELIATQGSTGTYGENLQGPDAERERTFRLAERLNDQLTEMSKDLGGMVEVINETSQGFEKGMKDADPLSQIVTVLNGHLNQLQAIDRGTTTLREKVAAAQAAARGMTISGNLLGSNAAQDFYKSYSGRK